MPGVVMSLAAGGLAVGLEPGEFWVALLAIMFGGGAALVLDEFAMLLHLDDVYWTTEGRLSIDAWHGGDRALPTDPGTGSAREGAGGRAVRAQCLSRRRDLAEGEGLVVVTSLKGKLNLGLLGIVFVLCSAVGAVRLAKPNSIWARWLYAKGGWRLRRSGARSASRHARWMHRRERFYDLIGGAPDLGSKRDSA